MFRLVLIALFCAGVATAPAVAINPPVNSAKPPETTLGDDAALQAEAADMLAKILAASDIKGYAILGAENTARLRAHAAWTGPNELLGTVTLIPGDTEVLLKAMPRILMGRDARNCPRGFVSDVLSGALPDEPGTRAARLFTGCRDNADGPIAAYYLGLPRKAGGIFIFGTVTVGNEAAAKSADASLRAAVTKVLPPD